MLNSFARPDWSAGIPSDLLADFALKHPDRFPADFAADLDPTTDWSGLDYDAEAFEAAWTVTEAAFEATGDHDIWAGAWRPKHKTFRNGNVEVATDEIVGYEWRAYNASPPDGSSKPSFDDLLFDVRAWWSSAKRWIPGADPQYVTGDLSVVQEIPHMLKRLRNISIEKTISKRDIHTGVTLEHVPALIHLAGRSAAAGAVRPLAVMRRTGGGTAALWTETAVHAALDEASAASNRIESAYNLLRADIEEIRDRWVQGTGDVSDAVELRAQENLYDEIAKAMDVDALRELFNMHLIAVDALPADLPTLKEVLAERTEAAAMKRVKEIKGVFTQQGVDLPAACYDEETALRSVAQAERLGSIEIARATTAAEAKTAFDTAAESIASVKALNTPDWTANGQAAAGSATVAGRTVTLRAAHPDGIVLDGKTVIFAWDALDADGGVPFLRATVGAPADDAKAHELKATFGADVKTPITLTAKSRNLCGPSALQVKLTG